MSSLNTVLKYGDSRTETFTIEPSRSRILDIDLDLAGNGGIVVSSSYSKTSVVSGICIDAYCGIGGKDGEAPSRVTTPCTLDGVTSPEIFFGSNIVKSLENRPLFPTSGEASTTNWWFSFNEISPMVTRWLRLKIINKDRENLVTIKVLVGAQGL